MNRESSKRSILFSLLIIALCVGVIIFLVLFNLRSGDLPVIIFFAAVILTMVINIIVTAVRRNRRRRRRIRHKERMSGQAGIEG